MKKLIDFLAKQPLATHCAILFGFIVLSLALHYPVIQGKVLLQSDTQQYKGMSRQLQENRAESGEELYWIDNAFGGMPTYQLGAKYPYDLLTPIHKLFRLLPHPTYLLFLYFLGAYLFLLSFGFRPSYALIGALAYGLSTYLLIIIQVGHNTKAQALGYMPFVFAAVHYLFQKRTLWGVLLASLAMALQIRANHYQMTYYMLLLLLLYGAVQAWHAYKEKQLKSFVLTGAKLSLAGLLAIALNASSLLATAEYTAFSTRGKSELTIDASGMPQAQRSGLSYDYITQFSYGIFESFNLVVPRIQGGGSREDLGTDSSLYTKLVQLGVPRAQAKQFVSAVPTYWGSQPILEAPAYVGVVVVFLAVLALFFPLNRYKKWLLMGVILSLFLSWGKNFETLTRLFINTVPLYSKFRAVSSIQVILEFCFPVLAVMGLRDVLEADAQKARKAILRAVTGCFSVFVLLFLLKGTLAFKGPNDAYYSQLFGPQIMQLIFEARKEIYNADLIRALMFVALTAAALLANTFKKLKAQPTLLVVGVLVVVDLLQISSRYLDRELYVSPSQLKNSFIASPQDRAILADKGHYRVYEPALGLQGARTAYFHNAIGGYHGAKPRRFEALIDLFQVQKAEALLNILNVKYILYTDETGEEQVLENPDNLGAAWQIERLVPAASANAAYRALTSTDFTTTAILESAPDDLALTYKLDPNGSIDLTENTPEYKKYTFNSSEDAFVVFSEMYYKNGWVAYIDGKESTIQQVNYVLRGLAVPAGKHQIEFVFAPAVIQQGSAIQLGALAMLLLLLAAAIRANNPLKQSK